MYVAVRPVFDRHAQVVGHSFALVPTSEPHPAPGSVVAAAVRGHRLDELVGRRLLFLPLGGDEPLPAAYAALPPDRLVLETGAVADGAAVHRAGALQRAGFATLVDGVPDGGAEVSFARLEAAAVDRSTLTQRLARCRAAGVRTLAAGVDTPEHFDACVELGFDLLQGRVLGRARQPGTLSPSAALCLRIVDALADPDVPVGVVEGLIRSDAALSFRVLRAVNSAAAGLRRPVRSVQQAVTILGLQTLRRWALTLVLADDTGPVGEPVRESLTRARMCELVAEQLPAVDPDAAFATGLLSSLHTALRVPLEELLAQVELEPELVAALRDGAGPLGALLSCVSAYESQTLGADPLVDTATLQRAYLGAVAWSLQTCESLLG